MKLNFKILFFAIAFLAFFGSINIAQAREHYEVLNVNPLAGATKFGAFLQSFTATTSNISRIDVKMSRDGALFPDAYQALKLCKSNGDLPDYYDIFTKIDGDGYDVHCKTGDEMIAFKNLINIECNTLYADCYEEFIFENAYPMVVGDIYYIAVSHFGNSEIRTTHYNFDDNYYPDGESLLPGGGDMSFILYDTDPWEVLGAYEYSADTTDAPIDPELLSWRSDINSVLSQTCFTGEDCRLWFSFNEKAIGNTVYLTPDVAGQQDPYHEIDNTTITFTGLWQNYVNLDIEEQATTTQNCLYMTDATYGDLLLCGIKTRWMASTTFYDLLEQTIEYDDICADIGTSSLLMYSIECGLKKFAWSMFFDVDPKSVTYLMNGVEKFKSSFPLNTFFSLTDVAREVMASTTLQNNSTLDIPLIDTEGQIYMQPVLASGTMSNLIGQDNSNLFRKFLDWMLWIGLAGIIVFIVISKHI